MFQAGSKWRRAKKGGCKLIMFHAVQFRRWFQAQELAVWLSSKEGNASSCGPGRGERSALPSQRAAVSQPFGATFWGLNQWELTVGILLWFASSAQHCICEFYSSAAVVSPFLLLHSILVHGINTMYLSCFDWIFQWCCLDLEFFEKNFNDDAISLMSIGFLFHLKFWYMFRNFPFHLTFTFICNYWIFFTVLSYYLSHIYRICNDAPFLLLILSLGPLYLFLMSLIRELTLILVFFK